MLTICQSQILDYFIFAKYLCLLTSTDFYFHSFCTVGSFTSQFPLKVGVFNS